MMALRIPETEGTRCNYSLTKLTEEFVMTTIPSPLKTEPSLEDQPEHIPTRQHSDEDIIEELQRTFCKFDAVEIDTSSLEGNTDVVPANKCNVEHIAHSVNECGFRKREAILAWRRNQPNLHAIITGFARFEAAKASNSKVFVLFLENLESPDPSKRDIMFAWYQAQLLKPVAFPRSEVAKVLEICALLENIAPSKGLDSITVKDLKLEFRSQTDVLGDPRRVHWTYKIKEDLLREFLKTAKVASMKNMIPPLKTIQKEAADPAKQVSQRFLFAVRDMENERGGSGKLVLETYAKQLQEGSSKALRATCSSSIRRVQTASSYVKRASSQLEKALDIMFATGGTEDANYGRLKEIKNSVDDFSRLITIGNGAKVKHESETTGNKTGSASSAATEGSGGIRGVHESGGG